VVTSRALTVKDYLASLPADRRAGLAAVRKVVRAHLPPGLQETMQYGMISYVVPLARFPRTYNGQPLAALSLAVQKNYLALYLLGLYGDGEQRRWFEAAYRATGKRLDMGKSCLRFRSPDDLPLEVVGQAIARVGVDALIALHEAAHGARRRSARRRGRRPPR
jgi:hypothetical protein